jgi:transcriptional regulator with XRE-family HTH domain
MSTLYDVSTTGAARLRPGTRVGAMVRELIAERHRQRLIARELLERIDGSWALSTFQAIEMGRVAPTAEFLILWAEALGRPLTLGERAS